MISKTLVKKAIQFLLKDADETLVRLQRIESKIDAQVSAQLHGEMRSLCDLQANDPRAEITLRRAEAEFAKCLAYFRQQIEDIEKQYERLMDPGSIGGRLKKLIGRWREAVHLGQGPLNRGLAYHSRYQNYLTLYLLAGIARLVCLDALKYPKKVLEEQYEELLAPEGLRYDNLFFVGMGEELGEEMVLLLIAEARGLIPTAPDVRRRGRAERFYLRLAAFTVGVKTKDLQEWVDSFVSLERIEGLLAKDVEAFLKKVKGWKHQRLFALNAKGQQSLVPGGHRQAIAAYQKELHRKHNNLFAHLGLAATYSLLGREAEAREAAAEVVRIQLNFSLERHAKADPAKNQADKQRVIDALRKAGLKQGKVSQSVLR